MLSDEGAGVHAVRALRERYAFPDSVEIIDGGTMGLDLLPFIEGADRLLIVDAVDFKSPPGTVRVVEGRDIKAFLDTKFSVHQIGLPDMLFAAAFSGVAPPEICLVGVQPERIETGLDMSDTLRGKLDEVLDAVVDRLELWGVEVERDVSRDTL
ncbi:MAG: HyaD/HybD family hydrogenase maturation endopeptidase [Thermodesulfovibrionales bacterium]